MVRTESYNKSMKIDIKEVNRYLGYRSDIFYDKSLEALVNECVVELESVAKPSVCFDIYDVSLFEDDVIDFGFGRIRSKSLTKNFSDCKKCIVFVATVGIDVDRLINKYSVTSPAKAVIMQSAGACAIEKWCDILCERFCSLADAEGKSLKPRFSPGYGDLNLEIQRKIIDALGCQKRIGVTLTQGLMMIPSKSVSAIVGISDKFYHCTKRKCELCDNKNCDFRS